MVRDVERRSVITASPEFFRHGMEMEGPRSTRASLPFPTVSHGQRRQSSVMPFYERNETDTCGFMSLELECFVCPQTSVSSNPRRIKYSYFIDMI